MRANIKKCEHAAINSAMAEFLAKGGRIKPAVNSVFKTKRVGIVINDGKNSGNKKPAISSGSSRQSVTS